MTPLEQFKADMEYNKNNILFTMENDENLGQRAKGAYVEDIYIENKEFTRIIFDNGHQYCENNETGEIEVCDKVPKNYFIHKYLEKEIHDFILEHKIGSPELLIYCTENEVSVKTLIKLHINREEKIVYLPNIMIPTELRFKGGIGKKLIASLYEICQSLNYRLVVVQMVESFFNSLKDRNGKVIDFETIEITNQTNLI